MKNNDEIQKGKKPDTRQRLLEAACMVFAEKGYRDATIQEICDRAGANVAAVNYHFGDKERLYDLAWRYAYDLARDKYPIEVELSEEVGPEKRLEIVIRSLLGRIFDSGLAGCFPKFTLRESAEPTSALVKIVDEVMRPHGKYVGEIMNQLLGQSADNHHTHLCAMSVISQCLFFSFNRNIRKLIINRDSLSSKEVDALADHIYRFVLAGIRDVRASNQEHQAS
jgi:AcrR family transcriptional regulator